MVKMHLVALLLVEWQTLALKTIFEEDGSGACT
jgi:hypothetical protein